MDDKISFEVLSHIQFQRIFREVNTKGFAAIDLARDFSPQLGQALYLAMDNVQLHPNRSFYYNEVSFYWPEDWMDVENGIGSFHQPKDAANVLSVEKAFSIFSEKLGPEFANAIIRFTQQLKKLVTENHHGLKNNEIRLSRVMVRQMNEHNITQHTAFEFHEDQGYQDRSYQQVLSVILTTFGIPTEGLRYQPKVGELVVFNARDRRRILGLDENMAFIHRGPRSGPKMFFFFEFLGPRD